MIKPFETSYIYNVRFQLDWSCNTHENKGVSVKQTLFIGIEEFPMNIN